MVVEITDLAKCFRAKGNWNQKSTNEGSLGKTHVYREEVEDKT